MPEGAGGAAATVWVLGQDNTPKPLTVRLGASNGSTTAIVGGELRDGQKVVVGTAPAASSRGPFGFRLGF